MNDEIKVTVIEYADRDRYLLQWKDPRTGKRKSKTSKVKRGGKQARKAAEREALEVERKVQEGLADTRNDDWEAFRTKYEERKLPGMAIMTQRKLRSVLNTLENLTPVRRVRDITAERLDDHVVALRNNGRSETTIHSHLAHIKWILKAAKAWGLIRERPEFPKVHRAKVATKGNVQPMKGRPITLEEFERMLEAVPAALYPPPKLRDPDNPNAKHLPEALAVSPKYQAEVVESMRWLLRGLWLSGLRLGEALELSWDDPQKPFVDLNTEVAIMTIPAECQKSNRYSENAIDPDFEDFLRSVPENRRHGHVFDPLPLSERGASRPNTHRVSRIISRIGKKAGVIVQRTRRADGTEKLKYASAHDLRRSYADRWSPHVQPQVLMKMMRQRNIETTLRYYVGNDARATASIMRQVREGQRINKLATTAQSEPAGFNENAENTAKPGV